MAKPLIVEIPHDLGHDEAKRRLETSTGKVKAAAEKSGIRIDRLDWEGDTLNFAAGALGQKLDGTAEVQQDRVRMEVRLPLLLGVFSEKVRALLNKEGTKLLTKK